MTIRLGYQIPNFTYPGTPDEQLFDTVVAQAKEAEAAGFDTVLVMDHFYQLPGIGTPDQNMLEAYTTLGALATATSTIQLSTLVTGNTYRNPALLAKTVTTLDVVSKGRAILGIGAGWFEREHNDLGFEFGTFGQRFERLEEALNIISPMLKGEPATFEGKWYTARGAMNNPRVRPSIPIMLGGSGEQKTFRLAARFAEHMNIICDVSDLARKVSVLRERCEEIGRDPATLATSYLVMGMVGETEQEVKELGETIPEDRRNRAFLGTAEQVAEQLHEQVIGAGIDGITINLVRNGHRPGLVSRVGEALKPIVAA
ncbi:LLM class F420-dependent oxidoreductase [Actinoplanes regularis]|uniref:Probable F420-dependent oxidoreductase, Rv1855c family n=1 Tax=Actinoplanes regularis TaxID=52697 RepID=A0A239D2V8_9ACTN|nr:LLM class F420-dependent oxidoreductase [Actinoplanes regularis]GIE88434.1 putative luciferase-like oxidoreductase [Actinoplanes regularis]GLW31210.1 putative luciferase-like oxidoreductase [Actinoplanes regularis]SNS26680.1 probable F420-dependent oxidoreductase, Rv1855c family [Actinoplanes regularis]